MPTTTVEKLNPTRVKLVISVTPEERMALRCPMSPTPHRSTTAVAWMSVKMPRTMPDANASAHTSANGDCHTARAPVVTTTPTTVDTARAVGRIRLNAGP